MKNDFFRAVAASPRVSVADVDANVDAMLDILARVAPSCPDLVVFPELSLTAYTCGDLFHNLTLLDAAAGGLLRLAAECPENIPLIIVGAPVAHDDAVYNCAVGLTHGRVLGIVPKTYLPNYNEFYERRWFATLPSPTFATEVTLPDGSVVPMASNLLFDVDGVRVGAEICEDMWVAVPTGCIHSLNGADIIANISASDDLVGKYAYLKGLVEQQSARCIAGYVYASSGYGESSTDLVFDGKGFLFENGKLLAEINRYERGNKHAMADIDITSLRRDRRHTTTFADCAANFKNNGPVVEAPSPQARLYSPESLMRAVDPRPFVPDSHLLRHERCREILHILQDALAKRLQATGCRNLVVGISGGLDSTLALMVAVDTFDSLGYDRRGIHAVTMPGFGTSGRTFANALKLMETLGVSMRTIPISDAVNRHFSDIGHDPQIKDTVYENSQARERTQILMDIANQVEGLVLGTGDLSELALGWCTYNADHMSMYAINSSVPKTLVRHIVEYLSETAADKTLGDTLRNVCLTPVSPELLPADENGDIAQMTEDLVGPYELHDFFIYHTLRHGRTPKQIFMLACKAFDGTYSKATVKKWLHTFFRRFFAQQFKRSCMPDGPKIGSVSLSPRGDWRMPSDAMAAMWLREIDSIHID